MPNRPQPTLAATDVAVSTASAEIGQDPWHELITAYREGPRQLYAPVILGLLESQINGAARRLRPPVSTITGEDIRQELVVQVLDAALAMPLAPDPQWIPRRLLLRARTGAVRWLANELRHELLKAPAGDPRWTL
jgi:hypothetical protein